jgi:hypothetical protein
MYSKSASKHTMNLRPYTIVCYSHARLEMCRTKFFRFQYRYSPDRSHGESAIFLIPIQTRQLFFSVVPVPTLVLSLYVRNNANLCADVNKYFPRLSIQSLLIIDWYFHLILSNTKKELINAQHMIDVISMQEEMCQLYKELDVQSMIV